MKREYRRGPWWGHVLGAGAALLLLPACGSIPLPRVGPVPVDAEASEVAYPPPPARVEVIPPRKKDGEVWVGGQWEWMSNSWKWLSGAWVSPPKGAYFTPWSVVRKPDGRLLFTAATWRARGGRALDFGSGNRICPVPPTRSGEVARVP